LRRSRCSSDRVDRDAENLVPRGRWRPEEGAELGDEQVAVPERVVRTEGHPVRGDVPAQDLLGPRLQAVTRVGQADGRILYDVGDATRPVDATGKAEVGRRGRGHGRLQQQVL